MTSDQAHQLTTALAEIEHELHSTTIPRLFTNNIEAHQCIANARGLLHTIDLKLFSCFRMMERFNDANRPKQHDVVARPRTPTIDDLEI